MCLSKNEQYYSFHSYPGGDEDFIMNDGQNLPIIHYEDE